jgi:CAAX protease family protein
VSKVILERVGLQQSLAKICAMKKYEKLISLQKEFIIYLLPPFLIISFYLVFHFLTTIASEKEAYLLGMTLYWILGCLAPAFLWISKTNRKLLLRIRKIKWWQLILVFAPVSLAFLFGPFRQRINEATTIVIILSLPYACVNAFCEEFLWRGVFYVHHQRNFFHAVFVPSVWFGIWHYVPLSVRPASIGNLYFIISAVGLGLCWGILTYKTRSIFWSIVSHVLVDFSGIGAMYYFR